MTRKKLYEWFGSGDITGEEGYILGKMGVDEYNDYYTLQDLKQMLRCRDWARFSEIEWNLDGKIKKIIFFTPNFNDSKPDASNYSSAIITDGNNDTWVIVYRPSYVSGIKDDVMIKRITGQVAPGLVAERSSSVASEAERDLNGDCPISGAAPPFESISSDYTDEPYVRSGILPYDARNNPDKYVLPLDIVKRPINSRFDHYAIYVGNEWVVELPGLLESVKFVTWKNFWDGGGSSSSSSSGSGRTKTVYHPQMPFKRKHDIIRHIAKAIRHGYGDCGCHNYNVGVNNCEHFANACVLGINNSSQGIGEVGLIDVSPFPLNFFNTSRNFGSAIEDGLDAINMPLNTRIRKCGRKFDDLTSNYYNEKERIERCINQAENNRSYTRSKYQIEQEKFEERIVVYPRDNCRVS